MRPLLLFVALAAAGAMPFSLRAAEPASKVEVARYAEQLLADTYASDGPGAALLIARGDEVLYRGSLGHADVDADVALTPDALFRPRRIIPSRRDFMAVAAMRHDQPS